MSSNTQSISRFSNVRFGVSVFAVIAAGLCVLPSSAAQANNNGLEFTPSLRISTEYDDNIYTENKTTRSPDSGFVTRIRPAMTIKKSEGRSHVQFEGRLEQFLFSDSSDNNHLNAHAGVSGRYSIDRNLHWDGALDYIRSHSRRGDNEADPMAMAKEALPLNRYQARTSMTYSHGPISVAPRLGYLKHSYENVDRFNGGTIRQDFRDRTQYTVGGRTTYRVNNDTRLYLDGEFVPRHYEHTGVERDSKGGKAVVGFIQNVTPELRVDAAVGYLGRNYDSQTYKNISTLAANANIRWDLQAGTRLRFDLSRDISETTATNTGGALQTRVGVRLMQDITPELTGNIFTRYTHSDYVGGKGADNGVSDRVDKAISVGVGASYLLTDALKLQVHYEYTKRDSNRLISEYDKNIIRVGVNYEF